MSLTKLLAQGDQRKVVAAAAVAEAEAAVRERSGVGALAAQFGLDLINRVRPGFLERHVHAMLPDLALAIEPHWERGLLTKSARQHLEDSATEVAADLLAVVDAYVVEATDARAIAVYTRLRSHAPGRVGEQMSRIATFIERHTAPLTPG